ncbi:MAG: hypothetical protein WDW38_011499 [Sanguina aurantia]
MMDEGGHAPRSDAGLDGEGDTAMGELVVVGRAYHNLGSSSAAAFGAAPVSGGSPAAAMHPAPGLLFPTQQQQQQQAGPASSPPPCSASGAAAAAAAAASAGSSWDSTHHQAAGGSGRSSPPTIDTLPGGSSSLPSSPFAPRVPSGTHTPAASAAPPPAAAQAPSHQHPCFPTPAAAAASPPSPAPHPCRPAPTPGPDPTAQHHLRPFTQGPQGQGGPVTAAAALPPQVSLFAASSSAASAEGGEAPHRWEAAEVEEYSWEYQMWSDAERASALATAAAAASPTASPTAGGGERGSTGDGERASTGGGERGSTGGRGGLWGAAVRPGSLSHGGSISMDGRASGGGFGVGSQGPPLHSSPSAELPSPRGRPPALLSTTPTAPSWLGGSPTSHSPSGNRLPRAQTSLPPPSACPAAVRAAQRGLPDQLDPPPPVGDSYDSGGRRGGRDSFPQPPEPGLCQAEGLAGGTPSGGGGGSWRLGGVPQWAGGGGGGAGGGGGGGGAGGGGGGGGGGEGEGGGLVSPPSATPRQAGRLDRGAVGMSVDADSWGIFTTNSTLSPNLLSLLHLPSLSPATTANAASTFPNLAKATAGFPTLQKALNNAELPFLSTTTPKLSTANTTHPVLNTVPHVNSTVATKVTPAANATKVATNSTAGHASAAAVASSVAKLMDMPMVTTQSANPALPDVSARKLLSLYCLLYPELPACGGVVILVTPPPPPPPPPAGPQQFPLPPPAVNSITINIDNSRRGRGAGGGVGNGGPAAAAGSSAVSRAGGTPGGSTGSGSAGSGGTRSGSSSGLSGVGSGGGGGGVSSGASGGASGATTGNALGTGTATATGATGAGTSRTSTGTSAGAGLSTGLGTGTGTSAGSSTPAVTGGDTGTAASSSGTGPTSRKLLQTVSIYCYLHPLSPLCGRVVYVVTATPGVAVTTATGPQQELRQGQPAALLQPAPVRPEVLLQVAVLPLLHQRQQAGAVAVLALPLRNQSRTRSPSTSTTTGEGRLGFQAAVALVAAEEEPERAGLGALVAVMNWDAAMMGSLPAVKAIGSCASHPDSSSLARVSVTESSTQRQLSRVVVRFSLSPLTIVTQATLGRMPQLEAQCKAWKGPLCVVLYRTIYQPDEADGSESFSPDIAKELKEDLATIAAFGTALDKRDACHLSILMVVEVFADRRALLLYPMNLLRNLARLQARTPMVAMLDVDILPSADLTHTLLSPDSSVARSCLDVTTRMGVVVLPTFETNATGDITANEDELADLLSQQDKAAFMASVSQGLASPFDGVRYPEGHNSTLFDRWYTSQELYPIVYGSGFEPFVIIDRKNTPWHDVRYRGYGWNKIVHLSLLNFTGFNFYVHPTAFVVHRAHVHSSVSNAFFESYSIPNHILSVVGKQHDGLKIRIHNEKLFEKSKLEMQANEFNVALDAATRKCMTALPWFRLPAAAPHSHLASRGPQPQPQQEDPPATAAVGDSTNDP